MTPWLMPLLNNILAGGFDMVKPTEGVKVSKRKIKGYQDGLIDITFFEPVNVEPNAPCLVYLHGGAFAF